jgi:hypothetical protein
MNTRKGAEDNPLAEMVGKSLKTTNPCEGRDETGCPGTAQVGSLTESWQFSFLIKH